MRRGAGGAESGKPDGQKQLPQCHYRRASRAPTVVASLGRGQAWTFIADTARQLGHREQIPRTQSPCHLPEEMINSSPGFFASTMP